MGQGEKILRAAAALFGGLGGLAFGTRYNEPLNGAAGSEGYGSGIAARVLEGVADGTVAEYPNRNSDFHYNVDWVDSDTPQMNAVYKGHPIPSFMRMQTLDEHNRALNKYLRPGMNPMMRRWAIEKGKEEEKKLDSYWVDDTEPRSPEARSSSTAVSGVHVNPDGTVSVQFRNGGKWYTYAGGPTSYEASMAAHDLVTADSMGQAINKKKGWWAQRHKIW